MKRKSKNQSSKVNRRRIRQRRRSGPAAAFLLTLCMVVSIGIAGMLLLRLFASGRREEKAFGLMDFGVSSEKIPKEIEEEPQQPDSRYAAELSDEEYREKNRIYAWESSSEDAVTFGFVGDFLLDDEYAIMASLLKRGITIENGISEPLLAQMREVDIMVANNEFPFTDRGTPTADKTFTFRADTDTVSYLHDMGVDVAVLANNHIYDFGEVGLLDTLDTLENAGIPQVGAGRNLEEASAPLYFIVNDMKIAVVAATQIERLDNPDTKGATESSAGVFRCWNPDKLYETVAKAKENSDFVIVYIHWGTENQAEPDWAQLEQAPRIAEAGADLIIGDHSHCLQGITYCGDTPVIYSMGNFWFNSKTLDTGMVKVTIGQEGLKSFQFVPAIQSSCKVDLAYGEDKERILAYMRGLSPDVRIDEEGFVSKN
ncbi:MAG: CapA family protein [Lachnospiraceae bacterium]|nr:CapA family protein [Lachnospiraceae bacterium]